MKMITITLTILLFSIFMGMFTTSGLVSFNTPQSQVKQFGNMSITSYGEFVVEDSNPNTYFDPVSGGFFIALMVGFGGAAVVAIFLKLQFSTQWVVATTAMGLYISACTYWQATITLFINNIAGSGFGLISGGIFAAIDICLAIIGFLGISQVLTGQSVRYNV